MSHPTPLPPSVPFGTAVRVWARIGLLSFGGPAGQVALMHKELVEDHRWIDEARFLHALNYCMLLPGPEAQQLATYIGWLLHKTPGALVAGTLFVLPGCVMMLGLSALYAELGHTVVIGGLFFGLKAAVLAVVAEAVQRIGNRTLRTQQQAVIALSAFAALFLLDAPFPLVVVLAGLLGALVGKRAAQSNAHPGQAGLDPQTATVLDGMAARGELAHTLPVSGRALRVAAVCLTLWVVPLATVFVVQGPQATLLAEGLFFSKAAVLTFGGAYAVLAYVAQDAVQVHHWLQPGEMLDGLGLAETTPGPLILVLQFVGFLAAYRQPAGLPPLAAGTLGALITVWVTFVPCFLWILLGAPYVEALRNQRRLQGALQAIGAAVVGVVANLMVWLALHTLFGSVTVQHIGPIRLLVPQLASLHGPVVVLALVAALALLRFKVALPKVLAGAALAGLAFQVVVNG
ncbi:MAG: chromate efflux transporter [Myxococcales bacterium]|nr:chromate efflux transporter [Myxococcales bacterium]